MKFLFGILFVFLIPSVQALELTDNMYFTVQANSSRCVDIIIPDDLGYVSESKVDYIITSTATKEWSDLTDESIVRASSDDVVKFPVCFFGNAGCSDPFVITISSPELGRSRDFNAGVCVSDFEDLDIEDRGTSTVEDVINNNVDFFDLGFETDILYLQPGESKQIKGYVQSYGNFLIDLRASGVTPTSLSVSTQENDPFHEIDFNIPAHVEGEYEVVLSGNIRGCTDALCSKTSKLIVIVGSQAPRFTVFILPKNVNVKTLIPIGYRMIVENNGDAAEFTTKIVLPADVTSNFQSQTFTLQKDGRKTINFLITPQRTQSSFDIKVTAVSGSVLKEASSQLSVNEMQTDALRASDSSTQGELNEWLNEYQTSEYGEDLESYRSLQDVFGSDTNDNTNTNNDDNSDVTTEPIGFDFTWVIIPVVIVGVILVVIIFMKKRHEEYFTPQIR